MVVDDPLHKVTVPPDIVTVGVGFTVMFRVLVPVHPDTLVPVMV